MSKFTDRRDPKKEQAETRRLERLWRKQADARGEGRFPPLPADARQALRDYCGVTEPDTPPAPFAAMLKNYNKAIRVGCERRGQVDEDVEPDDYIEYEDADEKAARADLMQYVAGLEREIKWLKDSRPVRDAIVRQDALLAARKGEGA